MDDNRVDDLPSAEDAQDNGPVGTPAQEKAPVQEKKSRSKKVTLDKEPPADDEADAKPDPAEAAVSDSRPLFLVSANGLDSKSFHAIDESDAARQFYKAHGVKEPENFQHRVQKVS